MFNLYENYLRKVLWGRGCDCSMVCISVRPEYENREPSKNGAGNKRLKPRLFDAQIGLFSRKNEWCSTQDFHKFLDDR